MSRSMIACRVSSYAPFEDRAYPHLAELGIRYVEIGLPPPERAEVVRAELDRYGLVASSVHGECDVRRPDVVRRVRAQMPVLATLGAGLLFVSVKAGDTPLPTVYDRLRAAGDVAAEHGVVIALETHPDLVTNGTVGAATMESVDHPSVRINYDTANVYFYNEAVDTVTELRKLAPWVASVHLKDTDGGYRHWYFPALGEGIIRFADVFSVLDAVGFLGPYTLEIEGIEGEERTEALVRGRIAASVAYLRELRRF